MTGCLGTICVTAIKGHYEDIPRGKHGDHEEMFVWHLRFPLPLLVGLNAEFD